MTMEKGVMMGDEKITIIGAGAGGSAIAADLTLAGWDVSLFEFPQFKENIEAIIQLGSRMNDTGYWRDGRTVEKIGIADWTTEQLKQFLQEGEV